MNQNKTITITKDGSKFNILKSPFRFKYKQSFTSVSGAHVGTYLKYK